MIKLKKQSGFYQSVPLLRPLRLRRLGNLDTLIRTHIVRDTQVSLPYGSFARAWRMQYREAS